MDEYIIEMCNITKEFPGIIANDDVTLQLKKGEIHALLVENGAGKSTLMSVLFGMYQPEKGVIRKNGQEVQIKDPNDANRLGIGMVHQHFKLVHNFTVLENIILGVETTSRGFLKMDKAREKVTALSERYGLRVDPDACISDITVGMQQRVEILKMLYRENEILIFDEPTAVLTPQEIDELMKIMKELVSEGKSILFITHKLNEIKAVADRCTVLRKGRYIGTVDVASTTKEEMSEMMVGRKLEDQYPHLDKAPGDIRLKVDNLCGPGVNDVSFTLRKGEILGVSGLMGAGRTELMKVLYGALPRTSGYVTLDGHEVVTRSPQDGLANGIVYISEDRKRDGLVLGMSVKENMSLTALRYFSRAGGSLKHADEQQAVSDFIRLFNVKTPSMEQAIGLLSGGNQQKVAIARGLMTRPKVLILDEPTRGVDVGAKKEIYQLINQFKADGLSIILVSSEMPEVLGMSDRIIVMHEGHLSGEFTREQATQEVLMAAAVGKLNRVNQE